MGFSYDNNEKKLEQGWKMLASRDDADSWDIDENTFMYHPERNVFLWRSASGCSCLDGEYGEEEYPTLDAIEVELMKNADDKYCKPPLKAAEELIKEAREAYGKICRGV